MDMKLGTHVYCIILITLNVIKQPQMYSLRHYFIVMVQLLRMETPCNSDDQVGSPLLLDDISSVSVCVCVLGGGIKSQGGNLRRGTGFRIREGFTEGLQFRRRCARTSSDRLFLAASHYGRSWSSSMAVTEQRHLLLTQHQ